MNGHTPKPTDALSGELWELKKERIRRSSAHGKLPGWDLRSVSDLCFWSCIYHYEIIYLHEPCEI